MKISIFSILPLLLFTYESIAQTCCSGGVPVSSNIGFPSSDGGILQFGLVYDVNVLRTLNTGTEVLDDDLRERKTRSFIVRGAYQINKKFTVESFIPFVNQRRSIITNSGGTDVEQSLGIGDPILLGIYQVINKKINWRIGAGPRIPLGSFSQQNDIGLLLLEDLQPGSGAWDLILLSSIDLTLAKRPSSNLYLNAIHSRRGVNNESRGGFQSYQFGNDVQVISGYSEQLFLFGQIINLGGSLRYRFVERDRVDSIRTISTGGQFLFARINPAWVIGDKQGTINFNFEVPIYANVNETQVRPTYAINISWSRKIFLKKPYSIGI